MRFASLALVPACLLLVPACASRTESQPLVVDPLPPRGARATTLAAAPAATAAPASTTTSAPAAVPEPDAARLFLERFPVPSIALSADVSPSRVLVLALDGSVRGETAGLSPEGPRLGATLAEGKRAGFPLTLPAGACITVVAHGGIGVVELDLFLTTSEPGPVRIVAQDARSGPMAVIGGKDGCFVTGAPFDGTLFVTARKGSGMALVQRFEP